MGKRKGKAPNGNGSVYQTKTGQWKVAITVPALTGRGRKITRNAVSHRQGVQILADLRQQYRNVADNPDSVSVKELIDRWLVSFEGESSTLDGYRNLLQRHIAPHIGDRLLSSLEPLDVQEWVRVLRAVPTGARTTQMAFALLKRACVWGMAIRLMKHNPCDGMKRPSAPREPISPFSIHEVKAILEATKESRLHGLFVLGFTTGMRQGEMFGLQWADVKWDTSELVIRRQAKDYRGKITLKRPKTTAGFRTISITRSTLAALSARRELSLKEHNEACPHVFCTVKGTVIRRTLFGKRVWKKLLAKLKISHRGAHHMRHTAATMMLAAGVPPHIVAGVLGHKSAETVMKIYAHFITNDSRIAADVMNRLVAPSLSGSYLSESSNVSK